MPALHKKILIVDDDKTFCNVIGNMLLLEGFEVLKISEINLATEILYASAINTVLINAVLRDGSGIALAKSVKDRFPGVHVIVMAGKADINNCVLAIKNGADNYIPKTGNYSSILSSVKEALFEAERPGNKKDKQGAGHKKRAGSFDAITGSSPGIIKAKELGKKVAYSNASVLLMGETGTGKELFARAIHSSSLQHEQSFVAINCSALSKELLESELFGYEAGAFTGANKSRRGLIEEAEGGTLFLDEIGEMHIDLQSKLLRLLETNEFIKVGSTKICKANMRLICATNKDLSAGAVNGRFREDLFYRINVFTIVLPPLRERGNDVIELAEYFIGLFSAKLDKQITGMTSEFKERLKNHCWKGNIRELRNTVERSIILASSSLLSEDLLPPEMRPAPYMNIARSGSPYDLNVFERLHIQKVLITAGWNKAEAARLLNISVSTLYRKIEDYVLLPEDNN